jgi:hypothetical protein
VFLSLLLVLIIKRVIKLINISSHHGFIKWNIFRFISVTKLRFRRRFTVVDGSEKEEEDDIEPRISSSVSDEETEALR